MTQGTYAVPDEPAPGRLKAYACQPLVIFLASMLGGTWLGWSWYVLNSLALGTPTRRNEYTVLFLGLAFCMTWTSILMLVDRNDLWPGLALDLGVVVLHTAKLLVNYALFTWQERSAQIHLSYGGTLRSPYVVLAVGFAVRGTVLGALPLFWRVVLA